MSTVLVTGGTGGLGREVTARLVGRGHRVRVLSHRAQPDTPPGVEVATGDLASGAGLREATAGVEAIVHCASNPRDSQSVDVAGTQALLEAARAGGRTARATNGSESAKTQFSQAVLAEGPQIVYISIVGVDRSAYGYYQAKYQAEGLIEQSGLPWTVLRATQFHTLVHDRFIAPAVDASSPAEIVIPAGLRFQSVDTGDVAERLAALLEQGPAQQTLEMGGPQTLTLEEMTDTYLWVRGVGANVRSAPAQGELFEAFRSGINLVPAHAEGTITWEQYLRRVYGR